ncbi:MAG: DUF481 domain-containing protein, partial [Proteobacteria bacterium]|nr:DUF481 domain-containing protein [Pseudomonadota bacterium]
MKRSLIVAGILAMTAVTPPAFAGDPKFEYGKADEVKDIKKPEWKASAEAGVIFTAGSSETTTATAGFKASRKAGDNKLSIEGLAAFARSAVRVIADSNGNGTIDNSSEITSVETVTAETFAGKLRYDRFLTTNGSVFGAALASRDVPAGKESVFGGQAGYSRRLFKSEKAEAVAELGYDFSRENPVSGPSISIHS